MKNMRTIVATKQPKFKSKRWEDAKTGGRKWVKNLKQLLSADEYDAINLAGEAAKGSYSYIDCGLSIQKPVKYCDIVGFHAKYTCSKTKMQYYNAELHEVVGAMSEATRDAHLSMRKANIVLK